MDLSSEDLINDRPFGDLIGRECLVMCSCLSNHIHGDSVENFGYDEKPLLKSLLRATSQAQTGG